MQRKVLIAFILVWIMPGITGRAQYENVWVFGHKAGVDFSTGKPVSFKSAIETREGCASFCNAQGELLFYTDGFKVWNRDHEVMPHGYDITKTNNNVAASTTQGALIVPVPGRESRYYIFSLGSGETLKAGLYYSVVDMNRDSGLGDVDSLSRGLWLDSLFTEEMTAVSGNDCNIWILVSSLQEPNIKAFSVTEAGISSRPVISPTVDGPAMYIAAMTVSPSRTKLAVGSRGLVLYDFDPQTGKVTKPFRLSAYDAGFLNYGLCFSPDNSKLYVGAYGHGLYQYDLSQADSAAIVLSKTQLSQDYATGSLKRGPDNKIYSSVENKRALNVIHQPNQAGLACQYEANAVAFPEGCYSTLGLPNFGTIIVNRVINNTYTDTALCRDSLLLHAGYTGGEQYIWDNGDRGLSRKVAKAGTYWLQYRVKTLHCYDEYHDTFIVRPPDRWIGSLTEYPGKCGADSFLMEARHAGSDYIWQDGYTVPYRYGHQTGAYYLHYRNDSLCRWYRDTFLLQYPDPDPRVSFEADSLVCIHNPLALRNTSGDRFNRFAWSFGEGAYTTEKEPVYRFSHAGTYTVMLSGSIDGLCADTVYHNITVDPEIPMHFRPDREQICAGESITYTLLRQDSRVTQLCWQWGDGTAYCGPDGSLSHAYEDVGYKLVTLHARFRSCPESNFSDTIIVSALPLVHLGADTGICPQGLPLLLYNRSSDSGNRYSYLWNTGDTTVAVRAVQPGIYSLRVTETGSGCVGNGTLYLYKDCYLDLPNAFSPNGDGHNDYFLPRQLLSRGLKLFTFQVFNRWGQLLFESSSPEGRGWDGRFKGVNQPEGAYIYQIQAVFEDHEESYKGHVTLIR